MISKNISNLNMALFDPDDSYMLQFKCWKCSECAFKIIESHLNKSQNRIPIWHYIRWSFRLMKVMSRPINVVFITTKNYFMRFELTNSIVTWFDMLNNGELWRRVKTRTIRPIHCNGFFLSVFWSVFFIQWLCSAN